MNGLTEDIQRPICMLYGKRILTQSSTMVMETMAVLLHQVRIR